MKVEVEVQHVAALERQVQEYGALLVAVVAQSKKPVVVPQSALSAGGSITTTVNENGDIELTATTGATDG